MVIRRSSARRFLTSYVLAAMGAMLVAAFILGYILHPG
jgi:hypothetical protein